MHSYYVKRWRRENAERVQEYREKYYRINREKILAKRKAIYHGYFQKPKFKKIKKKVTIYWN